MTASAISADGRYNEAHNSNHEELAHVIEALEIIYNPRSQNDARQAASSYLESTKNHQAAPDYGVRIACDKSQQTAIRYFGLSLLESAMRDHWDSTSSDKNERLRGYITELAKQIDKDDPSYLVKKMGHLWIELAKRSWAVDWYDMDAQLLDLWLGSLEKKGFVVYVLETLSEEVFNQEDPTAGLRAHDLGKACVEIYTPASILQDHFPTRDIGVSVRTGEEGWLSRLCDLLRWCLANGCETDSSVKALSIKVLSAIKATVTWVMPKAIHATNCVAAVFATFTITDVSLLTAAIEALFAIYRRSSLRDEEFEEIVCPMFTHASINTLRHVYSWSEVDFNSIEDEKYLLRRKLSELLSNLGKLLEHKFVALSADYDVAGFLALLNDVLRDTSLVVSIPVLHVWTRLLRIPQIFESKPVAESIEGILEICSHRLIRYESLPADHMDATVAFLNEDIDTIPERHAFLGNYRRYCMEVVEIIVRKVPLEAMEHILSKVESLLRDTYSENSTFEPSTFVKNSITALQIDAYVTVTEAALKGYLKWSAQSCDDPQKMDKDRHRIEDFFEQWCRRISEIPIRDPEVRKKIVQLQVTFSTKTLGGRPSFATNVLNYILSLPIHESPIYPAYTDAVKNLQYTCTIEAQKLAMAFPDHFLTIYDELEKTIARTLESEHNDDRQRLGYMSFLFIIIHRATEIDSKVRQDRLQHILQPVLTAWEDEELTKSLSSFESFCAMLGLEQLPKFLSDRQFDKLTDWGTQPLDNYGQEMQADLLKRFQQLPLRVTKFLIGASTEGVKESTSTYKITCDLWSFILPKILPNLLQLISHAQSFSDMERWSYLPKDLQLAVKRVLTDRFWQAGISAESKDEFYARVGGTRATFDGFASTVRGILRQIREAGYFILYGMSRLQNVFYGISDLPEPLAHALYGNAHVLSTHHFGVLLSMSTPLIQMCPQHLRSHFLPAILSTYFDRVNKKISMEWDAVNKRVSETSPGGDLDDEMKSESILRQVTYAAISSVLAIIDPQQPTTDTISPKEAPLKNFILSTPSILEPLFVLCRTILGVRDARCCSLAIRSIRHVSHAFETPSSVRDFLTCDMLKAAIVALHEPHLVDAHKELAGLIALLIRLDPPGSPRSVILSLPGMAEREAKVDHALQAISETPSERQQRSLVLDLLAGVRGVSIHELGKIERPAAANKKAKLPSSSTATAVQEQYTMSIDAKPVIIRGGSPDLTGVSEILG